MVKNISALLFATFVGVALVLSALWLTSAPTAQADVPYSQSSYSAAELANEEAENEFEESMSEAEESAEESEEVNEEAEAALAECGKTYCGDEIIVVGESPSNKEYCEACDNGAQWVCTGDTLCYLKPDGSLDYCDEAECACE